ncbi:MAG: UTP--glucose-1-phosphate uridylyltransferase [Roseiflexaceae bacterium]|nr:UTP--glucose-1-phosphate uridylyltransferase [Roseiflexaceae bacterium]
MTPTSSADFAPFAEKMRRAGLAELAIDTFRFYYETLAAGVSGMIGEHEITPVDTVLAQHDLANYAEAGLAALSRAVMLKLNGGLGTSMGLERAKSLLPVRDGLSFLDIIIRQVLYARASTGTAIPLLLMNSFSTDEDTQAVLDQYGEIRSQAVPPTMLQNKVPKIQREGLRPVSWRDKELEWCPPGHGDLYVALQTSGLLRGLIDAGYSYLFVSNADNLGATLDPAILGFVASQNVPFLMEVAARSEADKKGGHLARRIADNRLILREVAQCPAQDIAAFQDITRHRYFNTNNIWINLSALASVLAQHGGVIKLPMIRNQKTVDPRQADSPMVYQLETAMGAAIEVFENAQALLVDRARFLPVKTCNDLLALRSDIFEMGEDYLIRQRSERTLGPITIDLESRYYKLIDDFEARFPAQAPSLLACSQFKITGDVLVEGGVSCQGTVEVQNVTGSQQRLPAGILADQTVILGI